MDENKFKSIENICNDIIIKSQESLKVSRSKLCVSETEEVLRDNSIPGLEKSQIIEESFVTNNESSLYNEDFELRLEESYVNENSKLLDNGDPSMGENVHLVPMPEDYESDSNSLESLNDDNTSLSLTLENANSSNSVPKLEVNNVEWLTDSESITSLQLDRCCQDNASTASLHSCDSYDLSLKQVGMENNNNTPRLYEKKQKSSSEISPTRVYPSSSTLNSQYSPSSKSVKSMSAFSPNSSKNHSFSLFSSMNKKVKKKSLNALLDAIHSNEPKKDTMTRKHKSDHNLMSLSVNNKRDITNRNPILPRSNSTGERTSKKKQMVDRMNEDHATLHLTRLATSDLRNLEIQERLCHSSEVLDDEEHEDSRSGSFRREGKKLSPHPQAYYTIDSKSLASKHSRRGMKDKKLLYGIKQFNLEPKRGIQFLIDAGFLDGKNSKEVSQFLFREGRLSKRMIGNYIGGHETFQCLVLNDFVKMHEFTHLNLVQALRQFLWSFRLPGEAMQIDRVMSAFASHYCQQNPNLFDDSDTCYIISFSIIMLNTDLHNPNVKNKISMEQFVRQNKGINSGKDLDRDILELIYKTIKDEPFKIPDETYDDLMYTFFSPEKEGWLMKQGGSWKSWKRRWFVLSDRCLYYFQHTTENVPKGIIPLENVKVRMLDNMDGKKFCFEVFSESNSVVKGCKTDSRGTVVQGNHRSYRMSASTNEERMDWVQNIQSSIRDHPFHNMINSKKALLRQRAMQIDRSVPTTPSKNNTGFGMENGTPVTSTNCTPMKSSTPSCKKKLSVTGFGMENGTPVTGTKSSTPSNKKKLSVTGFGMENGTPVTGTKSMKTATLQNNKKLNAKVEQNGMTRNPTPSSRKKLSATSGFGHKNGLETSLQSGSRITTEIASHCHENEMMPKQRELKLKKEMSSPKEPREASQLI